MNRFVIVTLLSVSLVLAPGSSLANPGGNGMPIETTPVEGRAMGIVPKHALGCYHRITLGNETFWDKQSPEVTVSDVSSPSNIVGIFL